MNMLNEEYERIAPRMKYLTDKIILTQAWKKSHSYIRRHNWYVDILDLDCSIIDLENQLRKLSDSMEKHTFKTEDLRVVWAPKNQKWVFPEGEQEWQPEEDEEGNVTQDLRPLAHLTIKDQTAATAVMLCLADAIETKQGPTEEDDFLKAQAKKIYSYGNRLQCQWIDHFNKPRQAKFSWGSSKCYRQYFEDYKVFLRRPKEICKYYSTSLDTNKELYIVSLDLSKFYNHIDTNALIKELKNLYQDYYETYYPLEEFQDDEDFWENVKQIFNWKWDNRDYDESNETLKTSLGLPQGLVASGFLANAYMVGFDKEVGSHLKNVISKSKKSIESELDVRLLDYCRYVDDIRIVVEASSESEPEKIKRIIHEYIGEILTEHLKYLGTNEKIILNERKSDITSYEQMSNESDISTVMNSLQSRISGTPDSDSIHQIIGELVNLLRMSDILREDFKQKGNLLHLSNISLPFADVRDDTLKRFTATRLVKTLRDKKSMTVHSEKAAVNEIDKKDITAGQMLDHEFETVARNLISIWSHNPSLSLLLKCGLDLYPDIKLITPVLEALELKLYSDSISERKTAEYVVSDLMRAASLYIGYLHEDAYPENVDLMAFREELSLFAKQLIDTKQDLPWYVKQQAILFLMTNKDLGFTHVEEVELENYYFLKEALFYQVNSDPNKNYINRLATSFIAYQLNPNKKKFVSWFILLMDKLDDEKSREHALKTLAISRPDLLIAVINSPKVKKKKWNKLIKSNFKGFSNRMKELDTIKKTNEFIPLLNIIKSKDNPFSQENALLLLTNSILENKDSMSYLKEGSNAIQNLRIKCSDWTKIQDPYYQDLEIEWKKISSKNSSELITSPEWIEEKFKWMYSLGTILRSCMIGEYDFTAHNFLYREENENYKGIKSTMYTRQFSIINQGKGFIHTSAPVTPWISELLYKLLQWPGINQWEELIKGWKQITYLNDLQKLISKRIDHQKRIYGRLSKTPTYTLPIQRNRNNNTMRFVVVQPLLPQVSDFNVKDPTRWNEAYRKKHRDHLKSICHILSKQFEATISARKNHLTQKGKNNNEGIDVIIFPELSVHPDDIDILRSLSDKTKAHIFTGLTFIQHDSNPKIVNQALWLLRSEHNSGREFIEVYQGKQHMTTNEEKMGIQPYRPYQVIVEFCEEGKEPIRITGSICYDATDLAIAADLRDVSDVFIIAALNKDVQTFDNMISYLHYHMYQPVILANSGEFGGSSVQAPFTDRHRRTIAHVHGNQQIAISMFDLDPSIFKHKSRPKPFPDIKTPPAGYDGR